MDPSEDPNSSPFAHIVVCCTSIPADQRTDIATKVAELGGTHVYDLTHEVTHLIVGEYATPKYRHVARERSDVKPMDAGWVRAVSALWKRDADIDLAKLEAEWVLRPLEFRGADVKISEGDDPVMVPAGQRDNALVCLSGFDFDQRSRLSALITANGGRYTPDLVKEVSHLVVNSPTGKKYEAAILWNVPIVAVTWLERSVERGMMLEEKCFNPLLPPGEMGKGALEPRQVLGKRQRADEKTGPRKMRKRASLRVGGDDIWGNILGVSAPASAESNSDSIARRSQQQVAAKPSKPKNVFSDCYFFSSGFDKAQTEILGNAIESLSGTICASLDDVSGHPFGFYIIPQSSRPSSTTPPNVNMVTEWFVERCMHQRRFHHPDDHVLGRPFPRFPVPALAPLVVCTSGFAGIELNHVAQAVEQLGARFDETLNKTASVLVCKSVAAARPEKIRLARVLEIPVVVEAWLWICISKGDKVPYEDYAVVEGVPTTTTREVVRTRSMPMGGKTNPETGAMRSSTLDSRRHEASVYVTAPDAPLAELTGLHLKSFSALESPPSKSALELEEEARRRNELKDVKKKDVEKGVNKNVEVITKDFEKDIKKDVEKGIKNVEDFKKDTNENAKDKDAGDEDTQAQDTESGTTTSQTDEHAVSKLSSLLGLDAAADNPDDDDDEPSNQSNNAPALRRSKILGRVISGASTGLSRSSSAASGSLAVKEESQDEEPKPTTKKDAPPPTQVLYIDPEAQQHKDALMRRIATRPDADELAERGGRTMADYVRDVGRATRRHGMRR